MTASGEEESVTEKGYCIAQMEVCMKANGN
jgi:hypothetical protein